MKLEEEIINFSSPINDNNVPILLCGDLNAWCGEKNKFIINDIDDPNYNFNNKIIENFNNIQSLEEFGISTERTSYHKKVNNFGNRLIQLCKNNNIILQIVALKKMELLILLVITPV